MPTYTYKCPCNKEVSLLSNISERDAPRSCECGKDLTRVQVEQRVAPLLYSSSSPGTMACDKTTADFK